MAWDEYLGLPWHDQAMYLEGLRHNQLYVPDDYEGGDIDEDLDDLAAHGFQVGTEYH